MTTKTNKQNKAIEKTINSLIAMRSSVLSEREIRIIAHRLGILGETKHTLQQTADLFSLTREGVRFNIKKSIEKLRNFDGVLDKVLGKE